MFENIKDIILIILVIIVIYLLYKTTFNEKFTDNSAEAAALAMVASNKQIINESVRNMYKTDIDAMRNLAQIAEKILTPNSFGVTDLLDTPAKTVKINNLEVTDSIKFTNKNSSILEIFPRYMVIAWAYPDIPKGWALCDGKKYVLDFTITSTSTNYVRVPTPGEETEYIPKWVQTPDLRGRFILGSGTGVIYNKVQDTYKETTTPLTERKLNERDGVEKVALSIDEMPAHKHYYAQAYGWEDNKLESKDVTYPDDSGTSGNIFSNDQAEYGASRTPNTSSTGKNKPHENMPPFYVLTYIMKL